MGTVPTGTGQLRRIHSRVWWILRPVERSISVSPPHLTDQRIFSTSSSIEEATAELPMFVLILMRKLRPITIGSSSGWLMLAGMIARPRATSSRTNSGVISKGIEAPRPWPGCWRHSERSEEHTSELQSPCNLVCRLLLEKKKKKQKIIHTNRSTETRY